MLTHGEYDFLITRVTSTPLSCCHTCFTHHICKTMVELSVAIIGSTDVVGVIHNEAVLIASVLKM